MDKILKINYSESLKNYNAQLTSKLRDFGEKNLQLWVPDENIVLSILNMIFSVSQNDVKALLIILDKKDLTEKNFDILKTLFPKFSSFQINENMKEYIIQIEKIHPIVLEKTIDGYIERNKSIYTNKINIKKENKININDFTYKHDIDSKIDQIKNLYIVPNNNKKLSNQISSELLEKLLNKEDYFTSSNEKIKIVLKIIDGIVVEAKYNCSSGDFEKYYLDKFCNSICQLPIQEVYEHGVMKLEYFSRPNNLEKKIKGIVTPLITKKIFSDLQILMKNLWIFYCNKKNIKPSKNFFDKGPSKDWVSLNKNKKIETIQKVLRNFQEENNVDCLIFDELNEDNIRLTLNFKYKKISKDIDKSVLMLKFEKYIRNKLERRIEVFYKELKDANKLREKNTPI